MKVASTGDPSYTRNVIPDRTARESVKSRIVA